MKIYKRIVDFKNRGEYVDGDPRWFRKKFDKQDKRTQLTLWCEKEYRNLSRAFLAGVVVPRPIAFNDCVLAMNFLGADGWPAPTLKEVADMGLHGSSKKMSMYYCEILVQVKRLYLCSQLVHGDLSEYNILLVSSEQVRDQVSSIEDEDMDGEDAMPVGKKRIVLIDFAQAISKHAPQAAGLLRRDVERVNSFFKKYINETLDTDAAIEFITTKPDEVEIDEDGQGWVDLGGVHADVVEDESADLGEFEGEDASDTTSVKKKSWRHRVNISDRNEFERISKLISM